MNEQTTADNRHCWFCGQTRFYVHDATCVACGEYINGRPARGQEYQAWVDKALNDPDYLDRLARLNDGDDIA